MGGLAFLIVLPSMVDRFNENILLIFILFVIAIECGKCRLAHAITIGESVTMPIGLSLAFRF